MVRPSLRLAQNGAERLLTVQDVAALLRLSTATVYKLVDRGELAHLRVLNAIRFERAELDRFVAARRQ